MEVKVNFWFKSLKLPKYHMSIIRSDEGAEKGISEMDGQKKGWTGVRRRIKWGGSDWGDRMGGRTGGSDEGSD